MTVSREDLNIPHHLAIIMDGNGRWAKARGLPRLSGHRAGTENLRRVLRACVDLGIKVLTIYAFSTENWERPVSEVRGLMSILERVIDRELDELNQQAVKQVPNLPENGRVDLKAKGTYSGDEINFEVIDYRIESGDEPPGADRTDDESVERATPVKNKPIDFGEDVRKNSSKGEAIENATSND